MAGARLGWSVENKTLEVYLYRSSLVGYLKELKWSASAASKAFTASSQYSAGKMKEVYACSCEM